MNNERTPHKTPHVTVLSGDISDKAPIDPIGFILKCAEWLFSRKRLYAACIALTGVILTFHLFRADWLGAAVATFAIVLNVAIYVSRYSAKTKRVIAPSDTDDLFYPERYGISVPDTEPGYIETTR